MWRLVRVPLLVMASLITGLASAASRTITVNAPAGPFAGLERNGVVEFRGIRYAQPPVGALRWARPRPPGAEHREQVDGPPVSCPQNVPSVFSQPSVSEDCLFLNVFFSRSAVAGRARPGGKKPVIVWLHGGGLFSGSGGDYDGGRLAQRGDAVVVTLNYRLGALGFLAVPALLRESLGVSNLGLLDQRLALEWVKLNIAGFGGDPNSVMLAGQSSGATSVVAHLAAPGSAGLFNRAVIQSATRFAPLSREQARSAGELFAASVGCQDASMQCLRALSVQTILDHQRDFVATIAANFFVLDEVTGSTAPLEAFSTGRFNRMPVVTGLTADEQAYFLPEASTQRALSEADYFNWARQTAGARADEVLARYPVSRYGSPSVAEIAAAQDNKRCVVLKLNASLARSVPVYAYEFADRSAPSYFAARSYPLHAYHTAELQYLFPLFHGARGTAHPLNAWQESLSQQMILWWSTFARTGAPGTRNAPWHAFQPDTGPVLVIGADSSTRQDEIQSVYVDACAFWDPPGTS